VGAKIALHFRNLEWASVLPGEKHIKLWGSHDEEMEKRIFTRYCMRRLELSCFDLDERKYHYYEIIRKYKPVAIEAYTSALVKLARLMKTDGVTNIHVPSAIVSAETLTENNRILIEETLRCKVFNRYGSREFGNVAQECEKHIGLHINSESFLVEVISDGKPASPGKLGRLIITSFDNYAMPFIRYDTGDMGTASISNCSCGRGLPSLGSVDGRVTEFLVTPSGKLVPYLLFNYLFEQYGTYVTQFQVRQETVDAIHVKLVPAPGFTPDVEEQLIASFRIHLGDEMSITIEKVNEIPLTSAGKQTIIESKVFQ
jgi:phenylacetate-CoA ligase